MGFAVCRFNKETGCNETSSRHYHIDVQDKDLRLNVPDMWKHYMTKHLVQPTKEEREAVMSLDLSQINTQMMQTRSISTYAHPSKELLVLYVEKTDTGYSHEIGTKPDTEFIEKLEEILQPVQPVQTKGFKATYR